jgi:hypothetical protein
MKRRTVITASLDTGAPAARLPNALRIGKGGRRWSTPEQPALDP